MKPTLERSDQVVAHVVAWHNRHPLAQRITADQVHSVGVVSLPYAVRGAQQQPAVPVAEAAPPVEPALTEAAAVPEPTPGPPPAAEAVAAEAATEVAIEAVVEFETDAEAEPVRDDAAAAPTDAEPSPAAEPSILDRALAAAEAPAAAGVPEAPPAPPAPPTSPTSPTSPAPAGDAALPLPPAAAVLPDRPADLPPRPRRWHPLTWWARLRGQLPFHALFSEDFIAPLRPRQVRPWVARHGVGRRPLEPQAPRRLIVLDATRRRPDDDATEVDLHVITAAIGTDDGRHRLLLSPDGAVLGQRRWSRPRVAAAAGGLVAVLAGVGGGWMWRSGLPGAEAIAQHAAPAASSASAAASAVAVARAASQPASSAAVPAASQPAVFAASHPAAIVVAQALPASAPSAHGASAVLATVAAPASAAASATQQAPTAGHTAADAASAPIATAAAAPPAEVASAPRNVNPRRGRIELPPLVPRLAAAERHELRTSSRELRGQPAVGPDTKAWALVTGPLSDRRQSERVAAQLHAIALLQPVPMRAELMPAGNGWRAVFWPFPTAQDAEKVRLALADKGLRTEVLEF